MALVIGCSDGGESANTDQCSLVDRSEAEDATGRPVHDGVPFEHEESGDGTWCRYQIDGKRIELQFRPGDLETYNSQREQAQREGVGIADFDDIGDAAFFGAAGIPATTAFVDGHLLVVQSLDVIGDQAVTLTSSIARVGAAHCCPS